MSQANRVIKAAAVTTSVLLVAGIVSYRSGVWNILAADQPPAIENGIPDPADPINNSQQQPSGSSEQDPAMFGSSKSAILIVPAPKGAMMGGSKSLAPVVPTAPPSTDTQSPQRP